MELGSNLPEHVHVVLQDLNGDFDVNKSPFDWRPSNGSPGDWLDLGIKFEVRISEYKREY